VYKIDFNDEAFGKIKVKKKSQLVQPSDIDIHPKTGDIYITEGAKPKILVMTPDGKIKTVQRLKTRDFGQPEGISFSPDGKMYISNEGKGEPGNILELRGL
jgi:sugar lactone lactonase YvrE